MRYLITGGCGFLGSNIAQKLISENKNLTLVDNLSRYGSAYNLQWLKDQGKFDFYHADVRLKNDVERIIQKTQPDVIFHLAGQVAMTTSLENPQLDFEINVMGGINLLESVRKYCHHAIVLYSSTNKVYGDLELICYDETPTRYIAKDYPNGFSESLPLNFQSPYGCSKGATDQYMLDYARMYGLNTIVFRHSSIYGGRQFSTIDQGWIGWFIQQALETQKNKSHHFTVSGNGKQVRDLLYASDLVSCYFSAIEHIETTKGQVFNIGGGIKNSLSLVELLNILESELNVKLNPRHIEQRQSDQKIFVADIQKAQEFFKWKPEVSFQEGIKNSIKWNMDYVR